MSIELAADGSAMVAFDEEDLALIRFRSLDALLRELRLAEDDLEACPVSMVFTRAAPR